MRELLESLRRLGLPPQDFAVFGSGPLWAHGLVKTVGDLDVLARGAAWEQAARHGPVRVGAHGDRIVTLSEGNIEVFDGWWPFEGQTAEIIDTAQPFEGLPFGRLEYVLAFKRVFNRPKDAVHIHLLEAWLECRN